MACTQAEHHLRVLVADLFLVGLREMVERFHGFDGGADVAPALFLVERTIRRKQHVIGAEERDSANRRRAGAGERGVAVEALEIIERALLELLQKKRVVLIRGTGPKLVPAMGDAALEVGND